MVGSRIRLVHRTFINVGHSRIRYLAMEQDSWWQINRKNFFTLIESFWFLYSKKLFQKIRLIVCIDDDVKSLREKMQAEAKKKAELYHK